MPGGEVFDHARLGSHCFPGSPAAAVGDSAESAGAAHPGWFCSSSCTPAHGPVLLKSASAGECSGELLKGWCQCLVALDRAYSLSIL